jgi:sigma-B regulation protein RsbU (phosphoserine phosphatase)
MVTSDGTFLTYPDEQYILERNLFSVLNKASNLDSLALYHILNDGKAGTAIAYPEYLDYEKSWLYYTPIKETGWTLLFVIPYDELFVPLYLMVLRMLFFSVVGILIIFFIVTYISKKLIQPLSSVTTQLKKFSSLTGEISNTNDEVALVTESLDYLQNWYEKFKIKTQEEEQKNTQREHDLLEASNIQMSLINTDFSLFENRQDIDLFAIYKPARIVSGDLYDFIFLDEDHLFFTIGDVSGKGVSAAFFMSVAQTLLKSNSRLKEPGKIVRATNHRLYSVNQHQFFLTLFCGIIDLKTGVLTYSNAAHTPTLIIKSNGEIIELAKSQGMPLGLYPNRKYGESRMMLNPGDSIVLFSDGVTEQQNKNKKHFGINRICKLLAKNTKLNPANLVLRIDRSLNKFRGEMEQNDDITIMTLKFKNRKRPD